MLREIMVLSNFRHDNIVNLRQVLFRPCDNFYTIYLVTDLLDVDLSKIIRQSRAELTDDHIQYIMYQIFRALHFLRSLSPE